MVSVLSLSPPGKLMKNFVMLSSFHYLEHHDFVRRQCLFDGSVSNDFFIFESFSPLATTRNRLIKTNMNILRLAKRVGARYDDLSIFLSVYLLGIY